MLFISVPINTNKMDNFKKEIYLRILKSIGVYESFCLNLVNYYMDNNINPKDIKEPKSFYEFVKGSFDNSKTEEGEYFWNVVATKRRTPPIMTLDILCTDKFGCLRPAHFTIALN